MKKYVNVRLDWWPRQQNVIEMAVREQGAKARLHVLHFGNDLFARVTAAKHGYDALNMRIVFRKIPRREGDIVEEGHLRRVVELRIQFKIALELHQLYLQGGSRGVVHGKVRGGGKQLEIRSQWPDSCETRGDDMERDATTLSVRLHVIRYTSSKVRACLLGECVCPASSRWGRSGA